MLKGKIAGINSFGTNIVVKIKNDQKTKKRYTQFRQKLADRSKITSHGSGDFTKLTGKGIDINVFKGSKYTYLTIYGKNRKSIVSLLLENFEFMETHSLQSEHM